MPLSVGDKLGHFEILSLLGQGGMGEVYRAKDSKLDRQVAIKVLPLALARDAERLARFEREAKVLASLDHPNIGHIHGIVDSEDSPGLVLALIEGPTLADRIQAGPIALEEAIAISKQIIEALEYAHDRGVVHRDLKPANVKITSEGVVKVLDFGLAKVLEDEPPPSLLTNSPTLTVGHTRAGVILGTAAYMSPEQAVGRPVDRRSDIFSFGAVLYEMLTGTRAFSGAAAPDVLEAVVKNDPDWSKLPAGTSGTIRRLLQRCLVKDRKQRLQAIGEARIILDNPVEQAILSPASSALSARFGQVAVGMVAIALGLAAWGWWQASRRAPLRPMVRLSVEVPSATPLQRSYNGNMLALSPDGSRLAMTLRSADGRVRIHTRLLRDAQITALAGTENPMYPFFSPEGDWIGFFADGQPKKIPAQGGSPVTLCNAGLGVGASWGSDGTIIAGLGNTGVLSRIPASGGTPVPITKLNEGEATHRWPQFLPGDQSVLFTSMRTTRDPDGGSIDALELKTGERRTLLRGGFSAQFVADSRGVGYLLYLRQSTLFAVEFDPAKLAVTGTPAPVLENVNSNPRAGADYAFSPDGTFAFLSGTENADGWPIYWVDPNGETKLLHSVRGIYATPRFSPDGKRLAFLKNNGTGEDLFVKDTEHDSLLRLTYFEGSNRWPVWTPDGKYIIFESTNPAAPGLYWVRSDGGGTPLRLTTGTFQVPRSLSPDGKRLTFELRGNNGSVDIFTAPLEGEPDNPRLGKAELFLGTPENEADAQFSPDGKWLAYGAIEAGQPEIFIRPFPGPGGQWQVSTGGADTPRWSRGGRQLFFRTSEGQVMVVDYTVQGDSMHLGTPKPWTKTRIRTNGNFSNYDLAPDGKRLAALVADDALNGEEPHPQVVFLLNFADELRRRIGGAN